MADVKLCKDCKHCRRRVRARLFGWEHAECARTKEVCKVFQGTKELEYVSGQSWSERTYYRQCITERRAGGDCGPEGKHWEPRK